jgi:hypothetical protein
MLLASSTATRYSSMCCLLLLLLLLLLPGVCETTRHSPICCLSCPFAVSVTPPAVDCRLIVHSYVFTTVAFTSLMKNFGG